MSEQTPAGSHLHAAVEGHTPAEGGAGPRATWIRRRRALILGLGVIAIGIGLGIRWAARPEYQVDATLMFQDQRSSVPDSTPLMATVGDWRQLLKSFKIADDVVHELTLFLQTADGSDRLLFHGFGVDAAGFLASKYQLAIDRERKRWVLTRKPAGTLVDSGGALDSLGVKWGLKWQLDTSAFSGTGTRTVNFTLTTPRLAAVDMLSRLSTSSHGVFVNLTLQDPDPTLAANIVNRWVSDFVAVAAALKEQALNRAGEAFEARLAAAHDSLDAAERRLAQAQRGDDGGPVQRGIMEERLKRSRDVAAAVDTKIETQFAEWKIARGAATKPDVVVLDSAIAPKEPVESTGPRSVLSLVLASVGGILILAVLVDMARRGSAAYFRWVDAEEATVLTSE